MLDIQSLRETINQSYVRPDVALVVKYQKSLSENDEATRYLEMQRGFTKETIAHFHLGYNPEYDAISIPTFKDGTLVNIKYRILHPTGSKYIGEKGAETWVFNDTGFQHAVKPDKILIVEGEFDCISAWQSGIRNVISPASGKDSYGVWLERLDKIKKVYIAYDNDSGGRESGKELANRIGVDKSFDVKYPEGLKDANEYLLTHTPEDFRLLINSAKPSYTYQFKGMSDIIESLRSKRDDDIQIPFIPKVEIEKDWLIVISGKSNVGKTSYVLNIADYLSSNNIPTLVMPFERGIESVGKRFLQVKFDKTLQDLKDLDNVGWLNVIDKCMDTPVYFALPKKTDVIDTIVKSRRLFGTKVVIVDHLDYLVRHTTGSKEAEIGQTLQELKRVAEDNGIIMLIVTHIRKIDVAGTLLHKKPSIEDLKGSASLYQDPECVIMLDGDGISSMTVDIVKNKGLMSNRTYDFSPMTGKLKVNELYNEFDG